MREQYVLGRIVELVVMRGMLPRRMTQETLEAASPDGDADAEDAIAIKARFGIPAGIVMDDDTGERESLILGELAFRVVEEERVAPSTGW